MKNMTIILCLFFASFAFSQPTTINVEIDWMQSANHSHRPNQNEIDAVVQMFACQGITLNVVLSDDVEHQDVLQRNPTTGDFFNYWGGEGAFGFLAYKSTFQDETGAGWHYCLFAHQYQDGNYNTTGSSGLAEMNGDDLIVTLGAFDNNIGTEWDRASTFAHELGHNLGLGHAGSMNTNVVGPRSPNPPSIMTYFYQLIGVRQHLECQDMIPEGLTLYKNLDYSHGWACKLDEDNLDEEFGLGFIPIDWDCDGSIDANSVSQNLVDDINYSIHNDPFWCAGVIPGGFNEEIVDYDEWSNISDATLRDDYDPNARREEISCITWEEAELFRARNHCIQPAVINEPCRGTMIYVNSSYGGTQTGTCDQPYRTISAAQNAASDGDMILIAPGHYPEVPTTFTKQIIMYGPGNSIIGE